MVDLSRIVSVVAIEEVRLCESHSRSWVQPSDVVEDVTISASRDAVVAKEPGDDGTFRIEVTFKIEVLSAGDDEKPQAEVRATFELSYRIPSDESFSADALAAFARTNAVFNAWPYWREFVQATLARMLMPALTIPLFRLLPRDRDEDGQESMAEEPITKSESVDPTVDKRPPSEV
jgi:hypothetical protein